MNSSILEVLAERESTYGSFVTHSEISQALKYVLFSVKKREEFCPHKVEALEMICHKLARIVNGDSDYKDSWVDIAGYATLGPNCNKDCDK